ncbi:MAG: tetratricopeptide repeat protein [Methylophagaceae bacterium]
MNQMVTKLVESVPMAKAEGELVEPAFLTERLASELCSVTVLSENTAHKITRNINDLRSHVQRIYLFIKEQQAKAVYSALVDLFLVLQGNGFALRKRMLASAQALLSEQQFDALRKSLLVGLNKEMDIPQAELALVTQGVIASHQEFIQKNVVETEVAMSPIDEVRSYIEHGQLDQAQVTLQKAIVTHPHQLELHHNLLDIFQKTGDKDQFSSSYKQLLEQSIVLPPQWREMAQSFGIEIKTA